MTCKKLKNKKKTIDYYRYNYRTGYEKDIDLLTFHVFIYGFFVRFNFLVKTF